MPLAAIFVLSLIVILLVVFGVMIKYFKHYNLISGYNTMTAEQKRKVDTQGLGRLIGNFCFILAVDILLAGIFGFLGYQEAFVVTMLLLFAIIPFALVRAQKYDGNTRNPDGTMRKSTKLAMGFIIGGLLLVGAFAAGIIIDGSRTPVVTVDSQYIRIDSAYGTKIDMAEITGVALEDSIPKVIRKNSGFDFGNILRGNFRLEDWGNGKLYVDLDKKCFIHISTSSGFVIINMDDEKDTERLYNEIVDKLKQVAVFTAALASSASNTPFVLNPPQLPSHIPKVRG